MASQQGRKVCEVLAPEFFLEKRQFNLWDCYSDAGSNFNRRLHFHQFYELSVIYEGQSDFMINGGLFPMGAKSLQLLRPSDYHSQQTAEGQHIRYYNLMFSADFISPDLLKLLEDCPDPLCADATDAQWKDLSRLIRSMESTFHRQKEDPLTAIYLRANLENICIFILQHHRSAMNNPVETMQEPIRRALTYVRRNYREPIRLTDVAYAAGLSPSYFSALFHDTMGTPFSLYLSQYRLQIAERYLRSSDLSVKEVAAACGFSAYSYFVTAFKAEYGVPPGVFRGRAAELPK